MDEIVVDFKQESKDLINELHDILDDIEGEFSQKQRLEEFGQIVDRIMGSAKSLEMVFDDPTQIEKIGKYAELCKLVGYKASQIEENEQFFDIVVALLMDATDMLEEMTETLGTEKEKSIQETLSTTFLDRLQWVSQHFDQNTRASVGVETGEKKPGQEDIDALLKAMGL